MSKTLFEVKSALGKLVTCSTDTWNNHIKTGHSVMDGNVDKVIDAIQNPFTVYESNDNKQRDVYFAHSMYNINGRPPTELVTKVIVQNEADFSTVVSAWPQREIKGNINEKVMKYVRPKL